MQKHQICKRINQTKHQRSRKLDLGKRAPLSQATWALHPCPSLVFFQEVRQGRGQAGEANPTSSPRQTCTLPKPQLTVPSFQLQHSWHQTQGRRLGGASLQAANPITHFWTGKFQSDAEHSKRTHLQPDQPLQHSCQATLQPDSSTAFRIDKCNFLF